uniref:Synaptobrevin, longin-like domain protein n=1 Tax=Tanacetum cinerariifolium TaxID=118510 RepID=A0A699INW2_TANCI|nr:hypothetical protein [Tanacetum cinerariifolium]
MAKLAFCDYHNMVAILEKTKHNTNFYHIVYFLEASYIRIETTDQETKIIATVYGKPRTISESSLRRHLKLNDEERISSLPDVELFENLSLMGYNILSNQSNIVTAIVCLATNRVYNFSKMIIDGMVRNINSKGSTNLTKPHHTPSPQEHHTPQHDSPPPLHQTILSKPIPQAPTETLTLWRYTRRAIRIAQSKALSPVADKHASLSRDDRQGEAFLTVSNLDAGQDRENIAKTSALPHESSPRVPFLDADKDNQDLKISGLKARVKSLEDKDRRRAEPTQEDAPITRGIIDIGEELGAEKSTEKGSNDIEEMINVLSSMEAANILSSGGAATSVSPADVLPTDGVPTVSGSFPSVSVIFTTASMVTPYTRRSRGITIGSSQPMRIPIIRAKDKGKEKVIEVEVLKKRKLQEQIDAHVAREIKEESNEVIAKHLNAYKQAEANLSDEEKIELISELLKYQNHRAKILKYQAKQSKPLSKKEQREFYMSVLRSHARWKTKHFRGMTLEQIKEKFIPVKHPIIDWEIHSEGKREEDLHQLWTLVKETFRIKQATRDKEKELWVELKRLFEPDFKDHLWTHHQAFMHDLLDWKLYDTCGVHHVSTKDQEIFMLVEKDYPLRKGLATVMIIQDEELFKASSPGEHLIQET